ncbi:Sporulation related domain-containing protein [Cyclonatronum proteinivorum]|uniref:Sporulation related domain-containing protein n=1 Tax=Cyclonatronum proteinivorum TaxID=1457365 RepID=A0A345UJE6_9BACT|nr:SPOR domain-containing protein [Cyclonatronum proteinivorum]AXJ00598.1 Sporulation related domain-containing protein [Cyclonatronum proteinivorum]
MLKERIYRSLAAEIRNKVLRENRASVAGLGLFELERKQAKEEVKDGEVVILPPVNRLKFSYTSEIDDIVFFESQADRVAGEAKASRPFTAQVLKEFFAQVEHLQPGEYVQAAGLGVFLHKNGEVSFIPDDTLAREVNYEFAGQLAVRMKEGRPSYFMPKTATPEQMLAGFANVTDRPVPVKAKKDPKTEDTAQGKASEAAAPDPKDPKAAANEEAAAHVSETQTKGGDDNEPSAPISKPMASPVPPGDGPGNRDRRRKKKTPKPAEDLIFFEEDFPEPKRREQSLTLFNKVAAATSVLILLVIVVYLLNIYDVLSFGSDSRTVRTQPFADVEAPMLRSGSNSALEREIERSRQEIRQTGTAQPQGTAEADQTASTTTPDPDPREGTAADTEILPEGGGEDLPEAQDIFVPEPPPQPEIAAADPAPDFGLTGQIQSFDVRPFGIVLHSLASEALALEEKANFQAQGLRTVIYPITDSGGDTRWRVSVGQFETIEHALEAAQLLDEPWRSNNFISRLPAE